MCKMEYTYTCYMVLIVVLFIMHSCSANYCTQYYSCYRVCYGVLRYFTDCGFLGWGSCTRYRHHAYPCLSTCGRRICCEGYTGENCKTPICFGSDSPLCPNGGRCIGPDNCLCPEGLSGRDCSIGSDDTSCGRGKLKCDHKCTYSAGSYSCSCLPGYELQNDSRSCKDIDECEEEKDECDQICINTNGSFLCTCNGQMKISEDKKTCIEPFDSEITSIVVGWLLTAVVIIIFIGAIICFTMIFVVARRRKRHTLNVASRAPERQNAVNFRMEDLRKGMENPKASTAYSENLLGVKCFYCSQPAQYVRSD